MLTIIGCGNLNRSDDVAVVAQRLAAQLDPALPGLAREVNPDWLEREAAHVAERAFA